MAESQEGPVADEAGASDVGEDLARKLARLGPELERDAELSDSVPETRYARSGKLSIAYQVVGSGDLIPEVKC